MRNLEEDDELGYIFEVDLTYPSHLHVQHNSFPLAPEKIVVTPSMMSEYPIHTYDHLNQRNPPKTERLTATFNERKNYVVHYMTLKTYSVLGMQITNIHRVLVFRQSRFMTPFINFCTEKKEFKLRLV